jgi:hypothetical protein
MVLGLVRRVRMMYGAPNRAYLLNKTIMLQYNSTKLEIDVTSISKYPKIAVNPRFYESKCRNRIIADVLSSETALIT